MDTVIIVRPMITERSLLEAARGVFTFQVDVKSTKPQIRQALERLFSVHVTRMSTVIRKGKVRLVGRKRIAKKESKMKVARIQLKKGEKIPYFEVGQTK
jgi:large subunit ribosomal protein L23